MGDIQYDSVRTRLGLCCFLVPPSSSWDPCSTVVCDLWILEPIGCSHGRKSGLLDWTKRGGATKHVESHATVLSSSEKDAGAV